MSNKKEKEVTPKMENLKEEKMSPSQEGMMNTEKAVKIIESALNHANLKGNFTLEESTAIFQAISTLKS